MAAAPIEKKVTLTSCDGEVFEVTEPMALQSRLIKNMIEDGFSNNVIPVYDVTGPVLAKVIEYWKKHAEGDNGSDENEEARRKRAEELQEWDAQYANMERVMRFRVLEAANLLAIEPLLDLLAQAVADTIKDMTVEACREYMGIENDFTPEEEAQIKADNFWAFENP